MDMKKLLGIVDGNVEKTQLNEGVGECGMGGMGSSMPSTPPVTMSVNLNAQGVDNIKELLNLMRSAESGMGHDHSPAPMGMPMPAVGLDMPIKVTKISGGDGDKPEMNPAGSDGDRGMDQIKDLVRKAGIEKEYSNSPEEAYSDVDSVTTDAGGGWQEPKDPADIRVKDPSGYTQAEEEYANEPDEQYSDHNTMIKDLSGGINREKRQYAKAQDGDNAMAVRESSIRRQLDAMWKEIKEGSQPNPALDAALKKQELGEPLTPQEQRLIRMHTANDLANQQSPTKENTVATWGAEQGKQFKVDDNAKALAYKMAQSNPEFKRKFDEIEAKAREDFKKSDPKLADFSYRSDIKFLLSQYGIDPKTVDAKTFDPTSYAKPGKPKM